MFADRTEEIKRGEEDSYRLYAHKSLSSLVHLMLIEWTLNDFHLTPEEIGGVVHELTASIRAYI
ncbi:hypothetical protein D3C86_2193360 [compost metagenome]